MESVWVQNARAPDFKELQGDAHTDVLIIGGGIAGILCAYFLEEQGVPYILVEGNKVGGGITKNTTAVLTAQHDLLYGDLIKQEGCKKAGQYLHAHLLAVDNFRKLSYTYACDFEEKPSVMYSLKDQSKMIDEAAALRSLGFSAEYLDEIELPFNIAGAVKFHGMAQFNPLIFISEIVKDMNIYEHTFVTELKNTVAYTQKGGITAKYIIVATHFPFMNSHGFYYTKLYQQRSYVIALYNASRLNATYVDEAENGLYFRDYKDLLLIGGGDHRTGKQGGGFAPLRSFAKQHYPEGAERYAWATQDCMSVDKIPYIGIYSQNTPNILVATGFNEWGMTSSMVSAKILSDMIIGVKNEFQEVFSSQRSSVKKQLFINLGTTLGNFVLPVTKRCSHMGCALHWNKEEQSWDCACHGSRFDAEGNLIDNPAMKGTHLT